MRNPFLGMIGISLVLAAATPARAALYSFDFVTENSEAVGTLKTASLAPSRINSIEGSYNLYQGPLSGAYPITGLSRYAGADNQLLADAPFVDLQGLSIRTQTFSVNYSDFGGGQALELQSLFPDNPGVADVTVTLLSATTVPEPAVWTLMIGGVAATGVAMRRVRRTVAV